MTASEKVIARICRIPRELKQQSDVSVVGLLRAIGVETVYSGLQRKALQSYLEEHPALIKDWDIYSCDKRCSEGYYFLYYKMIVGYYESGKGHSQEERFDSVAEACAVFICKELGDISDRFTSRHP